KKRRGADAHRKQQKPAEPESEGERRRAAEDVVRARFQGRARKAVANREDVAMEMHGSLRGPGRSRREGDESDVVVRGLDVVEAGRLSRHPLLERAAEELDAL